MAFQLALVFLLSFTICFLLAVPFIKLLYKYNIRRVAKAELDAVLPGRQVKFGTPIMGGTIILIAIAVMMALFLRDWPYTFMVIIILFYGGIVGAIDEYTNTLGRTFKAIRLSKADKKSFSLFFVPNYFIPVKRIILYPWKFFEEWLRAMGSEQRGLKSHYKLLLHISLAIIVCAFFYYIKQDTNFFILGNYSLDLGFLYYPILAFSLLFFANAFGITDGMDGLSAGTHTVTFGFASLLALLLGFNDVALYAAIIAGAELAFLYFNINPARIEMSDVGTVPLGMMLVVIFFLIDKESVLLIFGLLYIVEIMSSVIQVWSVKIRKKRVFLVAPIHHHFEKMGWAETKVTMRFWLLNALFAVFGILVATMSLQ